MKVKELIELLKTQDPEATVAKVDGDEETICLSYSIASSTAGTKLPYYSKGGIAPIESIGTECSEEDSEDEGEIILSENVVWLL